MHDWKVFFRKKVTVLIYQNKTHVDNTQTEAVGGYLHQCKGVDDLF